MGQGLSADLTAGLITQGQHEFARHALTSKVVKPLVGIINLLIKSREAQVCKAKEELVEKLSRLL